MSVPDSRSLFILHRQELLTYLTRRTRDASRAQDLLQELFIRFIDHPAPGEVQDVRAYLFRMARNMLADEHRKQAGEPTETLAPEQLDDLGEHAPDPARLLETRDELKALAATLAELPQLTQRVFALVRLDGHSYREAAQVLAISESSVQKHLQRAVLQVMRFMEAR